MKIIEFTVKPRIPEALKPLQEMAHNLWVSWNYDAANLFIRLDYDAWLRSKQNPVKTLGLVPQERLEEMAADDSYRAALEEVYENFKTYQTQERWYKGSHEKKIAYFSMEYGLDVSLPIYSGGLGILSGDHMKTASDLGLPLVGVGLMYRQGYFIQYLNMDGFQQETYPENDYYTMPITLKRDTSGTPIKISVRLGDRDVAAQIWEVQVGKIPLYLLDSNIPDNSPEDRTITATLYGGGRETRIKQEILLGIGGVRALKALGVDIAVTHMNEGHSAFLGLERIRNLIHDEGLTYAQAVQVVWPTNIFTTHTPVPAGNERFAIELLEKYLKPYVTDIGLGWDEFLTLGRENPDNHHEQFCLTILALKLSAYNNGVSQLHGVVSRNMWQNIWKNLPQNEIPIGAVTNGVHTKTWLAPAMDDLLNKYLGPAFTTEPTNLEIWKRIDRISDEELWRTHERRREELVAYAREKLKKQVAIKTGGLGDDFSGVDALSPYNLTICFARRFATYKRANLLLKDPERLIRLLSDNERPIQFIFAGKAHPADIPGKELIKEIVHFANNPRVSSRIIFLENYDINLARYLTSGSDVWLNTPRRPLEASGTSGMKAGINGVLNVSVPDGWWDEAYSNQIGWAIGKGEEYDNHELHDEIESKALYDLLEREIIPLFYSRGRDNLPRKWIKKMKESMKQVGAQFCSHRMLLDYSRNYYLPALANTTVFSRNRFESARSVSSYVEKLEKSWKDLQIKEIQAPQESILMVGDEFKVTAQVNLANFDPSDVMVELVYGCLNSSGGFAYQSRFEMECMDRTPHKAIYSANVSCTQTGRHGYSIRILPKNPLLIHQFLPNFIKWG